MGILKAGVAESIEALRRSAGGAGRGQRSAQLYLKPDTSIKVRFLNEPTEFVEYQEHYDEAQRMFVPAIENDPLDQHPSEKVRKTSRRWLANILNVEDGRVQIVKLNQDLLTKILTRYQKYQTVCDRNYELIRTGASRDSRYDLDTDDPTPVDINRFRLQMHDMMEFLLGEVDAYHNTTFQDDYRNERAQRQRSETPIGGPEPTQLPAEPSPAPSPDELAAKRKEAEQKALDEKYGTEPPWSDKDLEAADKGVTNPTAEELATFNAAREAVKAAEASPPPPGATTGGATPPTLAAPSGETPGMAEIAAQTEAQKAAAAVQAAAPPAVDPGVLAAAAAMQAAQSVATADEPTSAAAPAALDIPDPTDPWAVAKANGQPCTKGEDGRCMICSFDVSECLITS